MRSILPLLFALFVIQACTKSGSSGEGGPDDGAPQLIPLPVVTGSNTFNLTAANEHVNVMGGLPDKFPAFPALEKKAAKLRGYVKDLSGKPLQGAHIGIRSTVVGGYYTSADAQTDAKGYYEMAVPFGTTSFWAAGVAVNYAGGVAAMSLYAADGTASGFNSEDGSVENFVLLSNGPCDPGLISDRPWYPKNYFGGSLYISYDLADPNDIWKPAGSLPYNGEIEITLTADGSMLYGETRSFVIKKNLGQTLQNFNINNIPVGKYKISAKMKDGTVLRLKATGILHDIFGLKPAEVTGEAALTFIPGGGQAKDAAPNLGDWEQVKIKLTIP